MWAVIEGRSQIESGCISVHLLEKEKHFRLLFKLRVFSDESVVLRTELIYGWNLFFGCLIAEKQV